MSDHDPRPTFKEIAEQHNVTMQDIATELLFRSHGGVSREQLEQVFYGGCGTCILIDLCLEALSYRTGREYTRQKHWRIVFYTPSSAKKAGGIKDGGAAQISLGDVEKIPGQEERLRCIFLCQAVYVLSGL